MPRTRSRPRTEEKFQNAVLDLIADLGCGALGINAVAQSAGADKVLIYRYFGDFNGLLQSVADSRQWLPTGEDILNSLPPGESDAFATLRGIEKTLSHHIRSDASTLQLVRWRRVDMSPLGRVFSQEWHNLWQTLPALLCRRSFTSEQRSRWHQACALLALMVEAELCNESADRHCLDHIAQGLEAVHLGHSAATVIAVEESLPTNLL